MRKTKYKMLSIIIMITMLFSSANITFAKNAEEPGEYSDEEWEEMKDQIVDIDGDSDWDHKTWDEEHREIVWMAFSSTEWTDGSFPSLNFSIFGTNQADCSKLTEEEKSIITSTVAGQKYITGKYSVKTTDDSGHSVVDNSAYIPLVYACMDTLKSEGTSEDPFAMWKYVIGGNNKPSAYNASIHPDTYVASVAKEIYRRIVNGERIYNNYHTEKANIFRINDAGTVMMIQSVVLNQNYCKQSSYNTDSASSYWETYREKYGYDEYSDFATTALAKYSCIEQLDSYVMDGFGHRIETTE